MSSPDQINLLAQQQTPQSAHFSHNDGGDDHEWSGAESDDGSGLKRKRPMSVSCELCKQRKVKCEILEDSFNLSDEKADCPPGDRGQPTCGWCAKNGAYCEYRERKKPGLRAGYGRELEARLDRLETILAEQQSVIAHLTQSNPLPSAPNQQPTDANVFNHPLGLATSEAQMQTDNGELERRQANIMTPQAPGMADMKGGLGNNFNGYQQAGQTSSDKSEHPMFQPNLEQFTANTSIKTSTMNQAEAQSSISQDHDLPQYDILYSLVDLYFKHINTWCPILQRRTTVDALFGRGGLDDGDRALLHAIVATTLRFWTDDRLTVEQKEQYHAVSKQKVLSYGLETSSVKALQALVVLALDLCGESNGPPGWNLLAMITRAAVQLGLSVEASSHLVAPRCPSIYTIRAMTLSEPASFIEDESRRRLFWMVYILDRYATITTAFEFALDEKEIDRKLPCRDDMFAKNQQVDTRFFRSSESAELGSDKPETLGSFSYYVEIVGILSRIHSFLKKPVDIRIASQVEGWQSEYRTLDNALRLWKGNLPNEYGNMSRLFDGSASNKIVNCGWVMLHATYFTTVMRLHSSAAYPSNRSNIFAPSLAASVRCQDAVAQTLALCGHVQSTGLLSKLGPPFAFSVWVAARLMIVHAVTVEHQINPQTQSFVNILRQLGTYWRVADRYACILQRVLDEFAESERNPGLDANGEQAPPSTVQLLADMRRCAFDLDFLISRQPRRASNTGRSSVTPARTPGASDFLEYLDMFDWFNMPRLPVPEGPMGGTSSQGVEGVQGGSSQVMDEIIANVDSDFSASKDWLR